MSRYAHWIAWSAVLLLLTIRGLVELARMFDVGLSEIAKLGPVATALAATVALVVGTAGIVQKARTDRRDQWWKRVQWGLDKAADDDEKISAVGFGVLTALLNEAATEVDTAMVVNVTNILRPLEVDASDLGSEMVLEDSTTEAADGEGDALQDSPEAVVDPDAEETDA